MSPELIDGLRKPGRSEKSFMTCTVLKDWAIYKLKNRVMTPCKAALIKVGLAACNNVEKTFMV